MADELLSVVLLLRINWEISSHSSETYPTTYKVSVAE